MKQTTLFLQMLASTAFRPRRLRTLLAHISLVILAALLALGLGTPAAYAQGYTENTLYSFSRTNRDNPEGDLTNVNGTLYGTTSQGGTYGDGTVFAIDTSGNLTTLHSFSGTDGDSPRSGLTNLNGTLYGNTQFGGAHNEGTIFTINTDGTGFHILYSFSGPEGSIPEADLLNVNGTLYGVAQGGGTYNHGTLFSIDTDGTGFQVLHSFNKTDGANPFASLITVNGVLYGTTDLGGNTQLNDGNGDGTIFAINTDGTGFQVLHTFNGTDGENPQASLTNVNGTLYGTTDFGGTDDHGTVFAINTDGTGFQDLHSFINGTDGVSPRAGLTYVNGTFFGTTMYGGGYGSVFSMGTSGNITTIYFFDGTHGANPMTNLTNINGKLYGTTEGGGTNGYGAVFVINPGPLARNDTYAPRYQTAYVIPAAKGVLVNDNGGGSPITATLGTKPTHGTLALNSDGSFTYTPAAGFVGTDSFTYQAVNSVGKSNVATVTLNVYAAAPLARNDTYAPRYQTIYVIKAPGVLTNDADYDTSTLTANLVSGPSHGSLTLNSDGSFTYTPAAGFLGADTFTYQAVNAIGNSNTATVTLNVYAAAPIAKNDTYAPRYQTAYAIAAPGVLTNDTNYDTGSMTATLVTSVSHGTLTLNSDGSFTYTPANGFAGADTFTYYATNGVGKSSTVTVTLNVYAAVPLARNDTYAPKENTAYVIKAPGVLGNDTNYDTGAMTATLVTSVSHGTLTLNSDGSFTYTPANGFTGADTFTYYATNGVGKSNTATVTLTVSS